MKKLSQEKETIRAMIRIYCRSQHQGDPLCEGCLELSVYADQRLDQCPYGEGKPTCQNCPIHCYQKEQRELIKEVMRFAGPKMIWHHPLMAFRHLIHNRKQPGDLQARRAASK